MNLLAAIRRQGMTQREFARAIGSAEPRLSELIRGWRDPSLEERDRIAAALHQPAEHLFELEDQAMSA